MIFKLNTAKDFFTDEEKEKYEKIGFCFKEHDSNGLYESFYQDLGKWGIDDTKLPTIIFDSIETLKQWAQTFDVNDNLIIDFYDNEITIYDSYVE